jgi:hypothetical protein
MGGSDIHDSGASRRGNARLCLDVIASEAKQPFFLYAKRWIASLSLAMTVGLFEN